MIQLTFVLPIPTISKRRAEQRSAFRLDLWLVRAPLTDYRSSPRLVFAASRQRRSPAFCGSSLPPLHSPGYSPVVTHRGDDECDQSAGSHETVLDRVKWV